eukprot:6198231-Pleurochrysis_carterae.AAC.1
MSQVRDAMNVEDELPMRAIRQVCAHLGPSGAEARPEARLIPVDAPLLSQHPQHRPVVLAVKPRRVKVTLPTIEEASAH